MTTTGLNSELVADRKSALTCLFCDKPQLEENVVQEEQEQCKKNDAQNTDVDSFWICSSCQDNDSNDPSAKSNTRTSSSKHSAPDCPCKACVERREMEAEQENEIEELRKCWTQLRLAVKQMYRDGLDAEGRTSKGKQFDTAKLKDIVHRLCMRDPHQLFQRLESQGYEYVMELKVSLLQILISPEKVGLEPGPEGVQITQEQAKLFLKKTLDSFSHFQEAVRNMHFFMSELDRAHLERFGITWKVVHHHLFDSVVYQDTLIQSSLPLMGAQLCVELIVGEDEDKNKSRPNPDSLPPAAFELSQSFRALDRLMRTSRQIWEKAHKRMQDFSSKQMKLYKATLKAKQKMLKEDLEFFKQQRRLLEEYVSQGKGNNAVNQAAKSSEEDLTAFAETLRQLLSGSRGGRQHTASNTKCSRCLLCHCTCDECTISHMITCGLVSEEDQELDPSSISPMLLNELPMLAELEQELEQSPISTDSSSESDEFDSNDGDVPPKCKKSKEKYGSCHPPSITPQLYSLHNQHDDADQHMQFAYGDWELTFDPAQRLFPSLPLESNSCMRKRKDSSASSGDSYKIATGQKATKVNGSTTEKVVTSKSETYTFMSGNGKGETLKMTCSRKEEEHTKESFSKMVPPQLMKIMKDETLAKAFKQRFQNGKRDSTGSPFDQATMNEDDLKEYFKELEKQKNNNNLNNEQKSRHTPMKTAVVAESKPPSLTPTTKEQKCVGTQVDPSSHEDDEDDWSDRSSLSQKDGRHCDCCYCEMFGHGGGGAGMDYKQGCGRDELPIIRERLRLKLKKKHLEHDECHSVERDVSEEKVVEPVKRPEPIGTKAVDELVAFIEGQGNAKDKEKSTTRQGKESKAAKRQRQKQKKKEERLTKEAKDAERTTANHLKQQMKVQRLEEQMELKERLRKEQQRQEETHEKQLHAAHVSNEPGSPKKKAKKKGLRDNVDDVFRPREDLDALDEVDRDVETFKKLVRDCQPLENRAKVSLNLTGIVKQKRLVTASSV